MPGAPVDIFVTGDVPGIHVSDDVDTRDLASAQALLRHDGSICTINPTGLETMTRALR